MLSATWPVVSGNPKGLQFHVFRNFPLAVMNCETFLKGFSAGQWFCPNMRHYDLHRPRQEKNCGWVWTNLELDTVFTCFYYIPSVIEGANCNWEWGVPREWFKAAIFGNSNIKVVWKLHFEKWVPFLLNKSSWIHHFQVIFTGTHTRKRPTKKSNMSHETNPCYF